MTRQAFLIAVLSAVGVGGSQATAQPAPPASPPAAPATTPAEAPAVLRPPQAPPPGAAAPTGAEADDAAGAPRPSSAPTPTPSAPASEEASEEASDEVRDQASGEASEEASDRAVSDAVAPRASSPEGDQTLEPAASGSPAAADSVPAGPRFSWTPFGFLRAQLGVVRDDPDVAFVGRSDGFSLQNARLGVRGALGERVSFEVSFDGAVDERERVNVPNGRLRVGLRDAFADFHNLAIIPSVPLSLRVGRFEAWFDPDGVDGDTERAFVDRALESRGISATEGWETEGLPPGRSLGVALRVPIIGPGRGEGAVADGARDERGRLWAELAVQNGADEFASGNDNDSVALSAALRLHLSGRGWLQAAARWNPRTEGELPFQQEEVDTGVSLGGGASVGPVRLAAGGALQYTAFDTTGGPRQRALGAHGQAMVRILGGAAPLQVGYRFAILDPSSLVVSDRLMEHTVGAVWAIESLRTRLQLNATHVAEQDERRLTNDRVELVVELRL